MLKRLILFLMLPWPAWAGELLYPVPYKQLLALPHRVAGFETLPPKAEPGHDLGAPLRFAGLWIGERLAGQEVATASVDGGRFDTLTGAPKPPLRIRAGAPKQSMAVAQHRGLGSNALFPVGPDGIAARSGRGEGATALLFDIDELALGLRLHAEYADPLGIRPSPGHVVFTFYDRRGAVLDVLDLTPHPGVMALAWYFLTPVAAVTVETTDPGGIVLDDILMLTDPPLG